MEHKHTRRKRQTNHEEEQSQNKVGVINVCVEAQEREDKEFVFT